MIKNKIALGTAQFGLDYGINNRRGRIPKSEIFKILSKAYNSGVDTLDTASAYGKSEEAIGEFILKQKKRFKIISKLSGSNNKDIREGIRTSLNKINMKMFYGYLIHHFQDYKKTPDIWNNIKELKAEGKINKIGFSLYFPDELEYLFKKNVRIDIVQVPYSMFDRRFEGCFKKLKEYGTEIHVRSVFLQGLVFRKPRQLDGYFSKIKGKIIKLNDLSKETGIPISAICFNFVSLNKYIDKIIVGVDHINNFIEILSLSKYSDSIENLYDRLSAFRENDEKIILPFNWKISPAVKS